MHPGQNNQTQIKKVPWEDQIKTDQIKYNQTRPNAPRPEGSRGKKTQSQREREEWEWVKTRSTVMLTHLLDQTRPAKTQRHTHKHSCWLRFRGHTQEPTLRRIGDKLSCSKNSLRLNSKATRDGGPGLQRSSACPHRRTRFCLEQISDWRWPHKPKDCAPVGESNQFHVTLTRKNLSSSSQWSHTAYKVLEHHSKEKWCDQHQNPLG